MANYRIIHFWGLAALLCCLVSCVEPMVQNPVDVEPNIPEDALVRLSFGVPTTVSTKSFGDKPEDLESMHVFVFSKEGMFIAAKKANFTSVSDNGVSAAKNWYVDLPMGSSERHVHFVANLGADWELTATAAESVLIRSLTTTGGRDAYWQRVILPHGISAYTYDGTGTITFVDPRTGLPKTETVEELLPYEIIAKKAEDDWSWYTYRIMVGTDTAEITVNTGDYVQVDGEKVLSGTGLFASTETSSHVSLVPLVRNFARIRVTNASNSNFKVDQAVLINTPKEGYVAPFDDRVGKNDFISGWTSVRTHASIEASGYLATIPASGINTDCPTSAVSKAQGEDYVKLYMYERGLPTENVTAVLVRGTLNNVQGRWVKIDLTDENGAAFPIFRDCTYTLTINAINGLDGYTSLQAAYAASSVGDIFSSPETATLTRVDDGKGLELWVEYVDYTIPSVTEENHTQTVTFLYRLKKTSQNQTQYLTADSVTFTLVDNTDGTLPSMDSPLTYTTAPYSGTDTPDGQTEWYKATFTLNNGSGNFRRSTIQVKSNVPGSKILSRDVTFRVLPPQEFQLRTTGLSADASGQNTTLTITLPSTLGLSAFPLVLKIESNHNNLTPLDNLPAETGTSSFTGRGNTYYFQKTINYSEYLESKVYTCRFQTTLAPGTGTLIRVVDKTGFFNPGTVALKVGQDSTYPTN